MQLATDAKLAVAKRRLLELKRWRFDNSLLERGGIAWDTDIRRRTKQILLLPLAAILIALLVPLDYLAHIWDVYNERSAIKKEIRILIISDEADVPTYKTIEELWRHCGLRESALSWEECLELLAKWLDILYGEARASNINVEARAIAIAQRQGAANRSFYEGKGGPHFHFTPPIESLVRELSQELPHYNMDISPSQPSTELQAWVDKREMHWRVKEAIHAEGGSIMLKSTTTDPTTLDEPLRSEAIEYLRRIGQWHD